METDEGPGKQEQRPGLEGRGGGELMGSACGAGIRRTATPTFQTGLLASAPLPGDV